MTRNEVCAKGYWFVDERPESNREIICSNCEQPVFKYHKLDFDYRPNYCPNCGAKMDKEIKPIEFEEFKENSILEIIKTEVLEFIDDLDIAMEICDIFDRYEGEINDAVSVQDCINAIENTDCELSPQAWKEITNSIMSLPPVKPVACIAKVNFSKEDMQEIVDKKVKEQEMEKHTDRQIYDGCINLMQKMVDYFQEYLDYLGYDLDKLGEDERFAVGISNMEIVRYLFLYNTRNSGGCSTRDLCEKLGVDPYKSVKFEFERDEEE